MATYKCRSCGHEVISSARPSGCECCGGRDFFIDYSAYQSLIVEISRLETEVSNLTRLETEKLSLEKKVAELQLKIQRRTKTTNPKVTIILFASVLIIISAVLGIFWYNQYLSSLLQYLR